MSFKMRRNFLTILSSLPTTWSASHHYKFYNSALIFLCLMLIDKDVCVCVCVNHLNVLIIIFVSSSFFRGGGGWGHGFLYFDWTIVNYDVQYKKICLALVVNYDVLYKKICLRVYLDTTYFAETEKLLLKVL